MTNSLKEAAEKMSPIKASEFLERLTKDMKNYIVTMSKSEAQQLVHLYYSMQGERIANANRSRQLAEEGHSHTIFEALASLSAHSEHLVKQALLHYTNNNEICQWMRSNLGIGPVISAGFISALDITKTATAGGFHRYCGLVEGQKRKKGQKLDFNPDMKRLCWLLGKSFVFVSKNPKAYYGNLYRERKEWETVNNQNLKYADKAKEVLENYKITDEATLATLNSGMLTKQHIDARARRYAVKLFLSHLHHVMYVEHYQKEPPLPYAIAHLDHVHYLKVPNMEPPRATPNGFKYDMVGDDIDLSNVEGNEDE